MVECAAYECVALVVHGVELGHDLLCGGWGGFDLVFCHIGSVRFSCWCTLKVVWLLVVPQKIYVVSGSSSSDSRTLIVNVTAWGSSSGSSRI